MNSLKIKKFLRIQTIHRWFSTTQHVSSLYKETIFALSSGFGKCGVAIIRVSGQETTTALLKMTKLNKLPTPRKTWVAPIFHPVSKTMIDRAMLIYFSSPRSFTGEDVCEFHVHGGPAVVSSVLDALSTIDGLRPAEAGDFTKRAFINNKLDLTEVEGLGDLIHAETEAQRKQALLQMEGSLSNIYTEWSRNLLNSLAYLEAYIDFSEDEQLEEDILQRVVEKIVTLKKEISNHLNDKRRGERLRNGLKVVIVGEPNVGKSSLMNKIVQRPAAIVSPIAGTTRDVIDSIMDIDGYPVIISDTAGLRESDDLVESEGVSRALNKLNDADLVILMIDAVYFQKYLYLNEKENFQKDSLVSSYCSQMKVDINNRLNDFNIIVAINKIDLISTEDISDQGLCFLSCKTDDGLNNFLSVMSDHIKELCGNINESPSLTQQRHRHHLDKCVKHLIEALQLISQDVVIGTEYVRFALNELSKITGKISSEEILDIVFKDFCIGK